jgi:hypothetical protein
MANLVLVGQAQFEINDVYAITCVKGSVKGDRPVTVKYGAQGAIGAAQGAEKVTASLEFAVPDTGLEFDVVGALNAAEGFSVTFPIGAEVHKLLGCRRTTRSFDNTPESGDTTFNMDLVATEWIRIR